MKKISIFTWIAFVNTHVLGSIASSMNFERLSYAIEGSIHRVLGIKEKTNFVSKLNARNSHEGVGFAKDGTEEKTAIQVFVNHWVENYQNWYRNPNFISFLKEGIINDDEHVEAEVIEAFKAKGYIFDPKNDYFQVILKF